MGRPGKCGVIDRVSSRTTTVLITVRPPELPAESRVAVAGNDLSNTRRGQNKNKTKRALLGTWPGFERTGRKTHNGTVSSDAVTMSFLWRIVLYKSCYYEQDSPRKDQFVLVPVVAAPNLLMMRENFNAGALTCLSKLA